jgi:hypothetical protein
MTHGDRALRTQVHFVRLPVMCAQAGLFVARDSRASTNSGPTLGTIAKPRSMCRTEHLIRIDRLSVSITTRRLFAYSPYLLPNIDPRESLGATGY